MEQTDQIDPLILRDAAVVWGEKEAYCAKVDHADIVPHVSFYRDGKLVLGAMCAQVDRDMGLGVALMGAGPVGADLIILHVDAHMTKVMNNPLTGEPWKPGEMQKACDDEGMCMTDILSDCITTIGVFKDGRVHQYSRPYHGHEKAGGMVWDDADVTSYVTGDEATASGLVVDTLLRAWENTENVDFAKMLPALGNDSTGREDADRLLLAARMLTLSGATAGVVVGSEDREVIDMVRERLENNAAAAADSDMGAMLYIKGVFSGWIEDEDVSLLIRQVGVQAVLRMAVQSEVKVP